MVETPWGEVPAPVRGLIDLLRKSVVEHANRLSEIEWPARAGDITPQLLATLAEAEQVLQASKDLRSLLTAYAHQVHQPRPKMADVARAQSASPQAVTTRYSSKTTAALEEILSGQSGEPETVASMIEKLATDAVVAGFPSLQTLRGPDVTWSTEDSADDLSFDLARKTESHSAAVEL